MSDHEITPDTDGKPCSVCHAKNGGNYLGIEACRACSVFYRRATTNGTILKCRTGTEACKLDRDNVWACKKCRFNQIRQIIGKQLNGEVKQDCDVIEPSCSSNCSGSGTYSSVDSPTYYLDELGPMNVGPILQRFRRCYNDLCRTRLLLDFGSLDNLPFNEYGFIAEVANSDLTNSSVIKQLYNEFYHFLVAVSDDYAIMREEYQTRLFSNFIKRWHSLECSFRTAKYFPNDQKKVFASFGRCLDMDNIGAYYDNLDNEYKEDVIRLTEEMSMKNAALWRPAISRLNLTDEEFIAASAYLLWNLTGKAAPDELVEVAEKNKNAVLHEMHAYYKTVGLQEYSARLGEIFMYLSMMERLITDSSHLIEVYKLCDIIDEETYNLAKLTIE